MGSQQDTTAFVQASRGLPQATQDGQQIVQRGDLYGSAVNQLLTAKNHALADEGSYFVATNPTPGTGLATIAALVAVVDTSPFILIQNPYAAADPQAKRTYLDYLQLICTAPGTASTAVKVTVKVDSARASAPTGGSLVVPVNPHQGSSRLPLTQVYAGALVAPAATSAVRLLGTRVLRPVIPVVSDVYTVNFGGHENAASSMVAGGVANANVSVNHAPVIIEPGGMALVHLWLPGQTAASSWEFEVGGWER